MQSVFGRSFFLVLCVLALLQSQVAAQTIYAESSFDADVDGWVGIDASASGEFFWADTDGNPGGYVRGVDVTAGATAGIAPSAFLGDWLALGITRLRFDHRMFDLGEGVCGFGDYRVSLSGPGGAATWNSGVPILGLTPWVTIDVPIVERAFAVSAGSWAGLLSDVTELRIRLELVCNSSNRFRDIAGLDNVILFQEECQQDLGFQGPGSLVATLCGAGLGANESSTYRIASAPANAPGVLLFSFGGGTDLPFAGGTLASFSGFVFSVPAVATPEGTLAVPLNGLPGSPNVVIQSVFFDSELPALLAFSNAVLANFGP